MKNLNLGLWALSGCVAAVLLAGCAGPQEPVGAPGAVPQYAATILHGSRPISSTRSDSKLSGETLTSTKVTSSCRTYSKGSDSWTSGTFHVRGNASGPFSGTFTARGQAAENGGSIILPSSHLDEHFTITSASQEISGHALYGNLGLPFICSNHILSFEISSFPYKLRDHRGGTASATLENGASGQTFTEWFK
jgi:hypothetical protein